MKPLSPSAAHKRTTEREGRGIFSNPNPANPNHQREWRAEGCRRLAGGHRRTRCDTLWRYSLVKHAGKVREGARVSESERGRSGVVVGVAARN